MPGKRSNGEGALRKRSSGLWECMIMTGFQPDGKRKYNVLQEEINELIQLVNQVQHKFMQSFKAIHEISGAINDEGYGSEIDECFDEEDE